MKRINLIVLLGTLAGIGAALVGCEWESLDSGYNTSKGAGVNVNFSGVYSARSGAASIVSSVSSISQFTIAQTGNALEVWDNNDSYYTGSVGSPGVVSSPDAETGAYSAGSQMVEAQIVFSGTDEATGVSAGFVGVVHAVAVSDVKGSTVDYTSTSTANSSLDTSRTNWTTTYTTNWYWYPSMNNGTTGREWYTPGTGPIPATLTNYSVDVWMPILTAQQTSTTVTPNTQTGSTTTSSTTEYSVTEANTQYVLQGNWSESGRDGTVYGISAASSGVFTTAAAAE